MSRQKKGSAGRGVVAERETGGVIGGSLPDRRTEVKVFFGPGWRQLVRDQAWATPADRRDVVQFADEVELHADAEGRCFPGRQRIETRCGLSRNRQRHAKQLLIDAGLLEISTFGRAHGHWYTLVGGPVRCPARRTAKKAVAVPPAGQRRCPAHGTGTLPLNPSRKRGGSARAREDPPPSCSAGDPEPDERRRQAAELQAGYDVHGTPGQVRDLLVELLAKGLRLDEVEKIFAAHEHWDVFDIRPDVRKSGCLASSRRDNGDEERLAPTRRLLDEDARKRAELDASGHTMPPEIKAQLAELWPDRAASAETANRQEGR